jgi:hypothetical protein
VELLTPRAPEVGLQAELQSVIVIVGVKITLTVVTLSVSSLPGCSVQLALGSTTVVAVSMTVVSASSVVVASDEVVVVVEVVDVLMVVDGLLRAQSQTNKQLKVRSTKGWQSIWGWYAYP